MAKSKKAIVGRLINWLCFCLALALAGIAAVELWYYPRYLTHKTTFDISTAENGDEIRVMSANVRCWSPTDFFKRSWFYRAELLLKNITAQQPDIIGFQEVMPLHYKYLTDSLLGYDSVIEYRDSSVISEGCPVFYNTAKFALTDKGSFWLSETPDAMSKDWDAACYRICSYVILKEKTTDRQLVVFNTHLDHVSDEARINGINVVLDKIKQFGGLPSIIMGDFNAGEDSSTYQAATALFDDAKYQTENTMSGATYQNWGQALDNENIDYFMISKTGINVLKYAIINATYDGVYPSDHFPIVINIALQ
ncbi:MAG: endonuclease/exonuclease/phosphatase family protein [Clostridia bacterium]|nr:endonuclease/exonuclease/phosphatase family protein [Clostridia bacterium]